MIEMISRQICMLNFQARSGGVLRFAKLANLIGLPRGEESVWIDRERQPLWVARGGFFLPALFRAKSPEIKGNHRCRAEV
jgi:hypothetical protein